MFCFAGEWTGLLFLLNWASGSVGLIISSVGTGSQAQNSLCHEALADYEHIFLSIFPCSGCKEKTAMPTLAACQAAFRFAKPTRKHTTVSSFKLFRLLLVKGMVDMVETTSPRCQKDHCWLVGASLFSVSLYNSALSFDVQSTISLLLECNKSPFRYVLWWQFLSFTGLWWSLLF